ncbi:hypothetical protein K3495_g3980 [Podosphaera aphanis]|nr:hypothetical protein K3495_g3980 [Podosphaera aphanis]
MIRRKPTAITLTTEDIAAYEDLKAREAAEKTREEKQSQSQEPRGLPAQSKTSLSAPNLTAAQKDQKSAHERIFGEEN